MITKELIARINELADRQRVGALTAAEKAEQDTLRRIYADAIAKQIRSYLDEEDDDYKTSVKH